MAIERDNDDDDYRIKIECSFHQFDSFSHWIHSFIQWMNFSGWNFFISGKKMIPPLLAQQQQQQKLYKITFSLSLAFLSGRYHFWHVLLACQMNEWMKIKIKHQISVHIPIAIHTHIIISSRFIHLNNEQRTKNHFRHYYHHHHQLLVKFSAKHPNWTEQQK